MNLLLKRWHPQIALRYFPIVRFLKRFKNLTVLEVGSGSLGIGPYFQKPLFAVDIDFSGPNWPKLTKTKAQAQNLPFQNQSFDIALSIDVLEHMPPPSRPQAVSELLRVTKRAAIIAVPQSHLSTQQDQDLDKLYKQKFAKPFPFLSEHLTHGLPSQKQVLSWIKKAAQKHHQKITVTTLGNRNLSLRLFLMKGWMTKSFITDIFFRKILLLFLPLLELIDKYPPHYRQIYFINIAKIDS